MAKVKNTQQQMKPERLNICVSATKMVLMAGVMALAVLGCSGTSKQLTDADRGLQPTGSIENGVRVIKLQAAQFEFTPDPMVVRVGERVRIEAMSVDVEHGLDIPGYNISQKLQPGKTETITFTANQEGVFPTHCSVFCGWGHMGMGARLIVLPR